MRPFSRMTVRSSTNRLSEHTPVEEARGERDMLCCRVDVGNRAGQEREMGAPVKGSTLERVTRPYPWNWSGGAPRMTLLLPAEEVME